MERVLAEDPSPLNLTRWLFLRLLGLVFLIAFLSLWIQVEGLIGSDGILPLPYFLDRVKQSVGSEAYWRLPTLFWIASSDAFLHLFCASGIFLSLLLIVGVAPIPVLLGLWALYLSLSLAGQTFLSFQWDTLLLETGFSAIFFAPHQLGPRAPWRQAPPPRAGLWLLRLLLFKLMFLSGAVKLISMDETWWNLRALDYHYFTQPLPLWTSWYAQRLPHWFQSTSVFVMFVIEIAAPFLIFFTRRLRLVACGSLILLQLLIIGTGSYGFFNLLSIVLCIPLLDDACLLRFLPASVRRRIPIPRPGPPGPASASPRRVPRQWVRTAAVLVVVFVSGLTLLREVARTAPRQEAESPGGRLLGAADRYVLGWAQPSILRLTDRFRTINGYGLFRAMTTSRPEIVIEGSADGRVWHEYGFRFKPGDVTRRPRLAAPHQPRLDWQMWFAALNPRRAMPWLEGLCGGLLEGSPFVVALLGENPFPGEPPRYVRLVYYDYRFTSPDEARATRAWWAREFRAHLTGPISRADLTRRR